MQTVPPVLRQPYLTAAARSVTAAATLAALALVAVTSSQALQQPDSDPLAGQVVASGFTQTVTAQDWAVGPVVDADVAVFAPGAVNFTFASGPAGINGDHLDLIDVLPALSDQPGAQDWLFNSFGSDIAGDVNAWCTNIARNEIVSDPADPSNTDPDRWHPCGPGEPVTAFRVTATGINTNQSQWQGAVFTVTAANPASTRLRVNNTAFIRTSSGSELRPIQQTNAVSIEVNASAVSGMTFADANYSSVQDPDEQVLPGVRIDAVNVNTGQVAATAISDANGHWVLDAVPTGSWQLQAHPPPQYQTFTTPTASLIQAVREPIQGVTLGFAPTLQTETEQTIWDFVHNTWVNYDNASPTLLANPAATRIQISATNTGEAALTDVTVADPDIPGCRHQTPILAPNQTVRFECVTQPAAGSATQNVSPVLVEGTVEHSDYQYPPQDQAEAPLVVAAFINGQPAQHGHPPRTNPGDLVVQTVVVTSAETSSTITGIELFDTLNSQFDCPQTTLEPDSSFTCILINEPNSELNLNVITATGTPTKDSHTEPISASTIAGHWLSSGDPQVRVQQTPFVHDEPLPERSQTNPATVLASEHVTWRTEVTASESGPPVSGLQLQTADGQQVQFVGGDTNADNALNASETWHYLHSLPATQNQDIITNADNLNHQTHSAFLDGVTPAIELTSLLGVAEDAAGHYPTGDTVTLHYNVANTGDVDLANITITTSAADIAVTCPTTRLAPGETMQCVQLAPALPGSQYITATATSQAGNTPLLQTINNQILPYQATSSDVAAYHGTHADLLALNPSGPLQALNTDNQQPFFTLSLSPASTGSVSNLSVLDNNATPDNPNDDHPAPYVTGDTNNNNVLDLGEQWQYEASHPNAQSAATSQLATPHTPTTDPGIVLRQGQPIHITAGNPTQYFAAEPAIEAVTVVHQTEPGPANTALQGTPIVWATTITNTGNTAIGSLQVGSPETGAQHEPRYTAGDTNNNNVLDLGEQWEYLTRTEPATPGQTTIMFTVQGTGLLPQDLTDPTSPLTPINNTADISATATATASVFIAAPGLTTQAIPDPSSNSWHLQVTNTGNTALDKLQAETSIGPLQCPTGIGLGQTVTCTQPNPPAVAMATIQATASATPVTPDGDPYTAQPLITATTRAAMFTQTVTSPTNPVHRSRPATSLILAAAAAAAALTAAAVTFDTIRRLQTTP